MSGRVQLRPKPLNCARKDNFKIIYGNKVPKETRK